MKYFDIKPATNDRLENWVRWMNRMETQLRQLSYYKKVIIKVNFL